MNRVIICLCISAFVWCGTLFADKKKLHDELIRLHIVAASDSEEDQRLKLRVRDAVNESLAQAMGDITDVDQAKAYLAANLDTIEAIANNVLRSAGSEDTAVATLTEEEFDMRFHPEEMI